ncbi:flagellar FliJ family protein [Endozoicomonas sp. OPT23]|uniref:flagellar export protein FliJ n=1 Tax=Endozoicomonas sp. OPT23 TaxID=2072845 RepID=UPI00129B8E89
MKRKKQLNRLLIIRQMTCDKAKDALVAEQSRLVQEEQRLEQLEEYRQGYVWSTNKQASGLALNSAQMMVERVDHAVRHQQHQVAVQEVQCQSVQESYQQEKRQVKTAEHLLGRHQILLNKKLQKQEQSLLDEFSARMSYGSNSL